MTFTKKIIISFLLLGFLPTYIFLKPVAVKAQAATETFRNEIPLQVPIPGLTKPCVTEQFKGRYCVNDIGEYISQFYKYFAGAAGILATVMILFSGYQYVTAMGNASRLEKAKSTMNGALIGLVLTLTAYVLLRTINPDLVSFKSLYLAPVKSEYLSVVFCSQFNLNELTIYDEFQKAGDTLTKGDLKCGQEYIFKKTGGTCLGHFCPQDMMAVGEGPLVCGPNFDNATFKCQNAQNLCENTVPDRCSEIDDVFKKTGLEFVCRKLNRKLVGGVIGMTDVCKFAKLFSPASALCQDIGQKRISCTYTGTNAHDDDTPCWDDNKPGNLRIIQTVGSVDLACNSTNRIGIGVDSFCCANIAKNKVECRDSGTNFDNIDKTLMEVSCTESLPSLGLNTPLNLMPGDYYTGGQICSRGCFMHVDLRYLKE